MIAANAIAEIRETEPARDIPITLCIRAWNDLSTCRPIGMTAGPIPWTAIVSWCEWHEAWLDREASMQLIEVIRQLDNEHFEREQRKALLTRPGSA